MTRPGRHARQISRTYDPDPEHGEHVALLSLQLFDQTRALHGLGDRERVWAEYGGLLHNVGLWVEDRAHHKHSRDILLREGIEGLTAEEVNVVAQIARYHRKAFPKPSHKGYGDLSREMQDAVDRIASLVRIADGLDRGQVGRVQEVAVGIRPKTVTLTARGRVGPESAEVIYGQRKADLFEHVFGRRVRVVSAGSGPGGR